MGDKSLAVTWKDFPVPMKKEDIHEDTVWVCTKILLGMVPALEINDLAQQALWRILPEDIRLDQKGFDFPGLLRIKIWGKGR